MAILGVVIGVSSVTVLVALGQGLKHDVAGLIQGFGTNVVVVLSGKIDSGSTSVSSSNPANFITGDILTLKDLDSIRALPNIQAATPLSLVSGTLKRNSKGSVPTISGVYPNVLEAFEVLTLDRGKMFDTNAGDVIVLGPNSARDLFENEDPIGQNISIGNQQLKVIGTLGKSKSSSLFGSQFDTFSLIPFDTATALNKNTVKIFRLIAKAQKNADVNEVKQRIHQAILNNHHGEEDFSVLTQDDLLGLFDKFLNLATTLVSAIAAISLIVGGIGIMNIMLVTVTERTREIGLRKAVGATRLAILVQFLTESLVITFLGNIVGLAISFAAIAIIAHKTELQPLITTQVIVLSVGISALIGITFGLWPATRAALKDPIEALRYE